MRFVALLRGINLGGANMMSMADLKAEFEDLGFENVKTYINSGNLAFDCKSAGTAELGSRIERSIEKRFGKQIPVVVRQQKDIGRILKNNPFDGQYESHKHMHVLFLKEAMPAEKAGQLQAAALSGEGYEIRGLEIYNHLPNGVAGSLLTKGFFERKPKVCYTGRNWRTVEKLAEL